ncbi:MAG: IS66 family transposase [Burkholderiales bacterium]|nr:IS66 family transposase [Burkholderiales bacterium]
MSPAVELSREELVALVLQQQQVIAEQQQVIAEQRQVIAVQTRVIAELQTEVTDLRAEVAQLREELARKGEPPRWAKPKTPRREKTPRKRRGKGYGRACVADPDEVVEHALGVCPDCGHPLTGGWEYSSHEVIDLPVQPARVVRHVRLARHCGVCGRISYPARADLDDGSVGRHRFSARVMSLVATWHHLGRLPLRTIQQILRALTGGLHISIGELRRMLDAVAARGQQAYAALRQQLRGSPVVQADETGWREDGQHGYLWAVLTPEVRYFERHASRGGQVIRELLGEEFAGIIVCDGYVAYSSLACWKQRCWVHLLRHGHQLITRHPEAAEAHAWVQAVRAVYARAVASLATPHYACRPEAEREALRLACQREILALASPHRDADLAEWRNLARFLTDHINELFVFVQHPDVPSHNNAAERAVRGPVTARKICGGTRSKQGSDTKMILFSLLQTCQVRGLDPITTIEGLLRGQPLFVTS